MSHTVEVVRNMRGELESVNELPIPSKPGYVLAVTTSKGGAGKVRTFVQACKVEPSGNGFSSRSFEMFGDFRKTVVDQIGRATAKTIAGQHGAVLASADALLSEAAEFYKAKAEKESACA